jgi:hypothetical protein
MSYKLSGINVCLVYDADFYAIPKEAYFPKTREC